MEEVTKVRQDSREYKVTREVMDLQVIMVNEVTKVQLV